MRGAPRAMPLTCLILAGLLMALFLAGHVAGLRAEVGILSGTLPGTTGGALLGVLYVLSWFGAVLVAPILGLAAILRVAGHVAARFLLRRRALRPASAKAKAVAARQP